ncbi:hypothetical protein BDFB_006309 [Asbolus verrucosus]|uniref:Uncharacterized protein n=1 Tax=Asbolus verrucosus TaxID=1661398 RepID=A0A482VXZ8_ASBVE|nr:hypothetical protein BDFB_006309 [Asbolus verrucosus]
MCIMTSPLRSFQLAAALLTLGISAQNRLPTGRFQQEIFFSGDESFGRSAEIPEIFASPDAELKTSLLTDIGFQQAGNPFLTPALPAVNLFTPNTVQQPAETPGQVANYRKALEAEAREAAREANKITTDPYLGGGIAPKGYVNVKVRRGDKAYNYSYSL